MKKISVFLMAMAMGFAVVAQSSVVAGGGEATGANGSVSYSVGQIATQFEVGPDGSLAEGVQQPYEISVVGIDEHPEITLNATVFPNPTVNSVVLKIDKETTDVQYDAFLLDVNGKLLKKMTITDLQTKIEMETFAEGVYFLKISNKNQSLKTFKIIKS